MSKSTKNAIFLAIIFLIILLLGGKVLKSCNSNDPEWEAYWYAQKVVENQLKSPSTAKFCSYSVADITLLEANKYQIEGYVDAENSFGATIRSYFSVTLTLTGDGYKDVICDIY